MTPGSLGRDTAAGRAWHLLPLGRAARVRAHAATAPCMGCATRTWAATTPAQAARSGPPQSSNTGGGEPRQRRIGGFELAWACSLACMRCRVRPDGLGSGEHTGIAPATSHLSPRGGLGWRPKRRSTRSSTTRMTAPVTTGSLTTTGGPRMSYSTAAGPAVHTGGCHFPQGATSMSNATMRASSRMRGSTRFGTAYHLGARAGTEVPARCRAVCLSTGRETLGSKGARFFVKSTPSRHWCGCARRCPRWPEGAARASRPCTNLCSMH